MDDGRVVLVGSGDRGPTSSLKYLESHDHIDLARVWPTACAAEVAQKPDRGPGPRLGRQLRAYLVVAVGVEVDVRLDGRGDLSPGPGRGDLQCPVLAVVRPVRVQLGAVGRDEVYDL